MSILLLVLMLVALIIVHEFGHFAAAKILGIHVEEFGIGYPPRALSFGTWRGTTYTLNWLPFGGFVKLLEEDGAENPERRARGGSFASAPKWKQAIVLLAGVIANAFFGWLLFTTGLMVGMPAKVDMPEPGAQLLVTEIVPGSPAENAGLHAGDEISAVKSGSVNATLVPQSIVDFVRTRGGKVIDITYARKGTMATVSLVPAHAVLPDSLSQPAIGMGLALVVQKNFPINEAVMQGARHTYAALINITTGLGALVVKALVGTADIRTLTGPVGLAGAVGDAAAHGFGEFLGLAGLISINLFVINLLPIPALDGGRLLLVIIEVLRKKKISRMAAQILNTIGFALIILLMLAVTYNDIARLIG